VNKKTLFRARVFLLLLFIRGVPAAAQEDEDSVYYIREINFDITGRTKEYAIARNCDIRKGYEVTGRAALIGYIESGRQGLVNRRELQQADIDFKTDAPDEDGRIPVDVTICTVDTRNFIILPEPKYSSNTGWSPAIRIRDFNFLGLMSLLSISIRYRYQNGDDVTYSRSGANLIVGAEIPFRALRYDWKFTTENIFSYYSNEPFSYGSVNGISVDIPFRNTTFTFGFVQGIHFGKEYDNWRKYVYSANIEDVWYGSDTAYGEWKIPLPVETEFLGALAYKPSVSGNASYAFRGEDLNELNGPSFNVSQKLGFEKIDWAGNFRRGADLYIENWNEYNFFFDEWNNSITANAAAHLVLSDFFGISMRGRFTRWFCNNGSPLNETRRHAGEMIRGMDDDALTAKSMFVFNFDFTFHIFNFMFSKYFNNEKLRLINFELQAAPILDIAIANGVEIGRKRNFIRNITYNPRDWIVSGGFELFVFPLAFRSVYLRGSAAWNLNKLADPENLPGRDDWEVYIGFGQHY
jgi:hypothetical protein